MSLPALATVDDILARAPELTDALNTNQAEALLADASAIIRAYAKREWVSEDGQELADVPDGITGICAMMVIRALRGPDADVRQETVGNYSVTYGYRAGERLYLTKAEKTLIRTAVSGSAGAFTISTHGEVGYLGQEEDEDWT